MILMMNLYTSKKHFLYKYGWTHSLDNKVMNLYLTVSACAEHVEIFVMKFVMYIHLNFN